MGAPGKIRLPAARIPRVPVPVRRQQPALRLIQPALRVGAVNDPAEHQAERMAARVAANAAPVTAPLSPAGGPLRRDAASQPNTDELTDPPVPADHADFELPATNDVPTDDLSSGDLDEMESGTPSGEGAPDEAPGETPVAPARAPGAPGAVVGREGGMAPPDVALRVASPGQGRPLPDPVRARMAPHFGTGFPDVRLHDTSADREAAARIGARAFTHGPHIWLGPGESPADTRLMAHELTHVVQQTGDAATLPRDAIRREEEGFFAGKAEGWARQVPGYTLMTVLVGKTLISGITVPMTATNLLGGLFGLVPGGTIIFDRLNETHAIENAFDWVKTRLSDLNITWDRFSALLSKAMDAVASWSPLENLKALFKPLVDDILTFVKDVTQKVLEFVIKGALKLAGPYADQVWAVIEKARGTLNLILEDPIAFAKNLISAIVGGFKKFGTNIIEHLKKGVLGWLFGAIAGAGIELPEKLDFKGIMSLLLQIIGATYTAFRAMLVKKLGAKGEKMVSFIEKSVDVVKTLLKEGFLGIWQKLIGMVENVKATIIGGMSEMVTIAIVKAGISWLAGLSNPVGAVVKVVLAIYDMVVTFIERLQQIWDVAQSIFSSIEEIARGNVTKAADFVEQTIGRTIPVVLSFLAALIGLNGIPSKIKAVFKKLQEPVRKAMAKMVDFIVKKAKKLFSKLVEKLNKKRKLPGKTFKVGDTEHSVYGKKKGKGLEFMVASKEEPLATAIKDTKAELPEIKEEQSKKDATEFVTELEQTGTETKPFQKVDMDSAKTPTKGPVDKLDKALTTNAADLNKEGAPIDKNVATTSKTEGALLRAKEPRVPGFEGKANASYGALQKERDGFKLPGGGQIKLSLFYELDHTIEKQFAKAVVPALKKLKPRPVAAEGSAAGALGKRAGKAAPAAEPTAAEPGALMGKLGTDDYAAVDADGTKLPAIATYEGNHNTNKGKGLPEPDDLIETAIKEGGANPANKAKELLKRQLDVELKEMAGIAAKDKVLQDGSQNSAIINADITTAFSELRTENESLFGLNGITAAKDERADQSVPDPAGSSEIPFEGKGIPKFEEVEAVGVMFGNKEEKLGHYFEYDHIVDDAYPRHAKLLQFGDKDLASKINAKLKPIAQAQGKTIKSGDLAAPLSTRLKKLAGMDLFQGTALGGYNENKGWSLPLYRVLHRQVSSDQKAEKTVKTFADTGRGLALSDLEDYVLTDNENSLLAARTKIRDAVQEGFRNRITTHGNEVKALYKTNYDEVVALQTTKDDTAAAKSKMLKIRLNLAKSLESARTKSDELFRPG